MRALVRTAAAAATALALLLTGCGGGDDGRADGKIRIRFQSLAWQKESVDINKQLVKEWNASHPDIEVQYVQGSWDSVHDQLLTSFEGVRRRTSSTTPPTTSRTSRTAAISPISVLSSRTG